MSAVSSEAGIDLARRRQLAFGLRALMVGGVQARQHQVIIGAVRLQFHNGLVLADGQFQHLGGNIALLPIAQRPQIDFRQQLVSIQIVRVLLHTLLRGHDGFADVPGLEIEVGQMAVEVLRRGILVRAPSCTLQSPGWRTRCARRWSPSPRTHAPACSGNRRPAVSGVSFVAGLSLRRGVRPGQSVWRRAGHLRETSGRRETAWQTDKRTGQIDEAGMLMDWRFPVPDGWTRAFRAAWRYVHTAVPIRPAGRLLIL